jgi:uncharacterized membrane protein
MVVLYILGGLLLGAFYLALFFVYGIGPILGLIGYYRVLHLRRRIEALEARLAGRETLDAAPEIDESTHDQLLRAEAVADEPDEPARIPDTLAVPLPAKTLNWEGLLGGRVLGWAAAVLMLLSFGYFIAYAFQNQWIGPVGQVTLGILGGTTLCLLGFRFHRHGYPMGAMLLGSGIVMLYLSVFASYGGYRLLLPSRGVLYQMLIVALSVGIAGVLRTRSIALTALLGGLACPLMIRTESDPYLSFFGYLLMLQMGMLALSLWRGWTWLPIVGLIGVQLLFSGWANGNYHPEKLAVVLAFQGVLFALHLLHDVGVPVWSPRPIGLGRIAGLVVATVAFAQAVCVFPYEDLAPWLPTLAMGMATLFALLAWPMQSTNEDRNTLYIPLRMTLLALSFAFLASAPALRLSGGWVGVAWAVIGLLLWSYAVRVRSLPLRGFALVLLSLAVFQEFFGQAVFPGWGPPRIQRDDYDPLAAAARFAAPPLFVPLFNRYTFPPTLVVFCLWLAAWQQRKCIDLRRAGERPVWLTLVLTGLFFGWVILGVDIHRFVRTLEIRNDWNPYDAISLSAVSVSVTWAVYAGVVLLVGFWRRSVTLRGIALALFGLSVLKALFFDLGQLDGIYRILALFALAFIMGLGAWAYQRLEHARSTLLEAKE